MPADPRTFGGVAPRDTATLERAPSGIQPHPSWDTGQGHRALSAGSEIVRAPEQAHRVDAATATVAPAVGNASDTSSNGMIGILQAAEIPREVVTGTMQWLEKGTAKSDSELVAIDAADLPQTKTELQHIWGPKYQANVDALNRYIDGLPAAEAEVLRNARDPETGRAHMNDPAHVVRLAGLARRPQPTSSGAHSIESIEAFMRSDRRSYDKDTALQARFRQLIEERERAKRNGA